MQRRGPRFEGWSTAAGGVQRAPVDHAWNETRTLTLAVLLMLGFQFRSLFEPGLARLPELYADLKLGSLGLTLLSLGWLVAPASRSVSRALVPLALSVGIEVLVAGVAIAGARLGWTMGGAAALLALLLWYGLRVGASPAPAPGGRLAGIALTPRTTAPSGVDRKIDSVLAEIRLVLPGAQALFMLQLSVALMRGFETLPATPRMIYLVSLGLMALAIILLVTPVAFHRIAQRGQSSERVHRLGGALLIAGMAVLALALSGDVYVAASRVARFSDAAAAAAAGTALFFYFLWFAVPLLRRRAAAGSGEPRLERG